MATALPDAISNDHATLELLETRLRRLEFLLTGSSTPEGLPDGAATLMSSDDSVVSRLGRLEFEFDKLRNLEGTAGTVVRGIELLHSKYPELFILEPNAKQADLQTLASIVLAHATLYPETSSRLSSLQSLQIPQAEQSAKLSALSPKILECQRSEREIEGDIMDLRERSARYLEWWVKIGISGTNEVWEDVEDRIEDLQRQLTRLERQRKEKEGYL